MILVAITGNICSGKSFLLKIIDKLGYKVFSCDEEIAEILKKDTILEKIKEEFSGVIDGVVLNKKLLAEIIFNDAGSRKKLEAILYPELFYVEDKFIAKSKSNGEKIVFCEVPLLYEKNLEDKYDFVITSFAPEDVLLRRAERRKIDQKTFYNILKTQLPSIEKEAMADYAINTNVPEEALKNSIMRIIDRILSM
jgi:dephospho-CoA kinase